MNSKQTEEKEKVARLLNQVWDEDIHDLFKVVLSRLEALEAAQAGLGKENKDCPYNCNCQYPNKLYKLAPKEETTPPCTCEVDPCPLHGGYTLAEKLQAFMKKHTLTNMDIVAIVTDHYAPLLAKAKAEERVRLKKAFEKIIEQRVRFHLGGERLVRARDVMEIFDEVSNER